MSSYDFFIDGINFSYSSASSFESCPYGFKLNYIDAKSKDNNFFAEYGNLIHEGMAKFFNKELYDFQLSEYYKKFYNTYVVDAPPPFPKGMEDNYINQGLDFFDNFVFDIDDYDVIIVEGSLYFELGGEKCTAKPDLVLKEKSTGKYLLFDYKTSAPYRIDKKTGKEVVDKKKIEGYMKQMYIYVHALREVKSIDISEINLWYVRLNKLVTTPCNKQDEIESIDWFSKTIEKIRKEENFLCDTSQKYFCQYICSVRASCKFW